MRKHRKKTKKGYFPTHEQNRMKNEGNVKEARDYFFSSKNKILYHLVEQRYSWMNRYIYKTDKEILELGCGAGLSRTFIRNQHLLLTDVAKHEWVDKKMDALHLDCPDHSLDVIISSHMIHHLANPAQFFAHAGTKLKSGGRIIIQDIYTGWLMKLALRLMRHEGYSDDTDVFDRLHVCNLPDDPWSANCSVPKLLFFGVGGGTKRFEQELPMYRIRKRERNECLMFFLSGGVIAKTWYLPAGEKGVKIIQKLDRLFVKLCPAVFASGCSIVLERV